MVGGTDLLCCVCLVLFGLLAVTLTLVCLVFIVWLWQLVDCDFGLACFVVACF